MDQLDVLEIDEPVLTIDDANQITSSDKLDFSDVDLELLGNNRRHLIYVDHAFINPELIQSERIDLTNLPEVDLTEELL